MLINYAHTLLLYYFKYAAELIQHALNFCWKTFLVEQND